MKTPLGKNDEFIGGGARLAVEKFEKKQEDSPLKTPPTKKAGALASENATVV